MSKHPVSATHDTEGELPTGLIRRGGRYSIRRRVPVDLVEHLGKVEITRALGTADPKEARRLLPIKWSALDKEFKRARLTRDANKPPSPELAPQLTPRAAASSFERMSLEEFEFKLEGYELQLAWDREDEEAYGQRDGLRADLRALLAGPVDQLTPEQQAFKDMLGDARFEADLAKDRLAATANAGPAPTPTALPSKAAVPAQDAPTLETIWKRWKAERPTLRPRAIKVHERVYRQFEAHCGRMAVSDITRKHVIQFMDALIAEGKTPANTNVILTRLRTLLNFAAKKGLASLHVATGVAVLDNRKRRGKRHEWSASDLTALFTSPVYAQDHRPVGGCGEAAYWLPLLALYTGARQTELGQLHPEDVAEETYVLPDGTERSAWVIRIVENPERNQWVKNEGSERRVPIHADLIGLGFLEVAAVALEAKRERIFHELRPGAHSELMGNWSKWFGRYRRAAGVDSRATPFHAFRNSFKHYASLSRVSTQTSGEITGHESGDVGTTVYRGLSYPLDPLVEGIALYRVPGIKLPAPPPEVRARRK